MMRFGKMILFLVAGAAMAAPASAAQTTADREKVREAVRAERQADRLERMLDTQHQQWQQRQRELPRLIEPRPLDLRVPMYTPPPRL